MRGLVQPGWISKAGNDQVSGAGYVMMGPNGALRSFYEVRRHSLGIFHHLHSLPFALAHSDNFQKTKLLVGFTQLITIKVAFREEYVAKHLNVIMHWNQNEKIYMMGLLDESFSDLGRHDGQFTIFPH